MNGAGAERMRSTRRRAWALAVVAFVGVSVVMLWPGAPQLMAPRWPHFDKLAHVGAWFLLAVAAWPALRATLKRSRATRALMIVGALGLWGIGVELLQGLVPHRSSEAWDGVADIAGALLGTGLMIVLETIRDAESGPGGERVDGLLTRSTEESQP